MTPSETSPPASNVLAVEGLRTYYYTGRGAAQTPDDEAFTRAVDGISFTVPHHGTVGIAGESGSGKTQTVLSILGLLDGAPGIVDGAVYIDGTNVLEGLDAYCTYRTGAHGLVVEKDVGRWHNEHQRRLTSTRGDKGAIRGDTVAMVFQEPKSSLSPYFSVAAHFRETIKARYGRAAARAYKDRALHYLEQLDFAHPARMLERYPHELSGGESQRVMLGLALMGNPQLLIADEPTTQLDALTQRQVIERIACLVQETKVALLLITHNLAVMRLLVDQVAIMYAGKIVEWGATASVITPDHQRNHPYTQVLLRAVGDTTLEGIAPQDTPASLDTRINGHGCAYFHRCPLVKEALTEGERATCEHTEPPLVSLDENHKVACWYVKKHYEYTPTGTERH